MSGDPSSARTGFVSLVGAGPGDPDLLTVRALHRIGQATAIVYDALVSEGIRTLFPEAALAFDAGKRGGSDRAASQAAVNALLVDLARSGHRVVRLKGGDPLVFGRGGEEALALQASGIPWEIVPGISASHGAAASARVPLTHRAISRSCTLIEGHEQGLHRIDWRALVALGGTWVFFMGKGAAREIAEALLRHGADPSLPVAIVENATLPAQTEFTTTLSALASAGYTPRTDGPGLVIAGPTVGLFHELSETLEPLVAELGSHERVVPGFSGPLS